MREQIPFLESEVDAIIARKETDSNTIARCLDNLLSFTDHGMAIDTFMKLIGYYETINPESACFYLKEFNQNEEGYNE
ncbi:hypothetical protein [Parapedobacter sp. DT-150]|uniref:hypothetical protein n=1 Tax=Parapedobacter sp. DT-150 TaxID=3396162 RepID=UPI003F1CA448